MRSKPLISVITPCHNSALFVHRLLDSVLQQTYPNVEMICVDNDSKDNTADIINSYVSKFEEKGYSLQYIHEDDLGPSTAINNGLKLIQGDYLVMPDSDDWYSQSESFEKYINKFESLPDDYAIIRTQLMHIREEDMQPIGIVYEEFPEDDPGTLFEDCLFGRNSYCFAPIDYMVKVSKLREMTGLNIYNAYNTGQQRQVCLPLYYKYKAWTIPEPLAYYLVRKSSISHGDYSKYPTQSRLYKQAPVYIDSILKCCHGMSEKDCVMYRNKFLQILAKKMLFMAMDCGIFDYEAYYRDYINFGGDKNELDKDIKKFNKQRRFSYRVLCYLKRQLYKFIR